MTKPSNWHREDGFEFALYPAKSGEAKSLVIVLHGHGSNTENWDAQSKQIQADIPDADVINLQGPVTLPVGHPAREPGKEGFTWIAYEGSKIAQVKDTLSMVFNRLPVVHKLNSFIDRQLKKRGLTEKDLGLVGSSMGGIVALQTALSRKKPIAGVVSHSGALLPFTKVSSKPDILLIMGGKDDVFYKPEEKPKGLKRLFNAVTKRFAVQHKDTLQRFRKKHIPFTEVFYPAMGHETTPESIGVGNKFIIKVLNKNRKPKP